MNCINRLGLPAMLIALAMTTGNATAAGKEDNPVLRMSSGSADGDKSYYTIWCKNKTIGSVIAEHDKQRYCALTKGGKRRCNKQWSLSIAAKQACQSGQ